MKWVTREYKKNLVETDQRQWHKKFCLKPRKVKTYEVGNITVPEHRVWLEYVERRRNHMYADWEYRDMPSCK